MKKAPGLLRLHGMYWYFSIFTCSCVFLFYPKSISAQAYYTAEKSFVLKLGTTRPLSESISIASTDLEKRERLEENRPSREIPNFGGRRQRGVYSPDAKPKGADPLFRANHNRDSENEILPFINFEGMNESDSGVFPPDINGDVGRDYYVEIVNSTLFRVFDKTGNPVSDIISANTIWSQVQQTSSGDPILLYDQEVDRWFLTEFPPSNRILVAISHDADPRGSWDVYTFQTPRFPDYPKYGIWHDSYIMTDNESGSTAPLYAINRHDLLIGLDTVRLQRLTVPKIFGASFEVSQPVDWDGMNPPPFGSPGIALKLNDDNWGTTNFDHIIGYKIYINWENSTDSHVDIITMPTAPFDTDGCLTENTGGFSCVPQPNGQGIDGAEWIIMNKAMYRNFGDHESIVLSFMADVTGEDVAGIRWVELRKAGNEEWSVYQEGTVGSDDGLHRFMSSIGIDGQGNIGLAYSISGFDKFPSLRYTGRYANDSLGKMTFKEIEFATGSGSLGDSRFGDYAAMSVDPASDLSFWFSGEYILANGNWATRVVAFNPGRDTFDIYPLSLVTPKNNPALGLNEPLSICISNKGLFTVDSFDLAYTFEGGPWISEPALIDSLQPDSIYCHTFLSGLDFNNPGTYQLRIATELDVDRNHRNDTLSFLIYKQPYKDIAFEYIVPVSGMLVCSDSSLNSILIRNLGADTITSALIQLLIEDVPVDTLLWTGELATTEEDSFRFTLRGLLLGPNHIRIEILEVNGATDEIPINNSISWTLNASSGGEEITIHLTTDNHPTETTWKLTDDFNTVIASGGPYSELQHLYSTTFCVDPEMCYTFKVSDLFGDGMSSNGVKGSYQIYNGDGDLLASIIKPNFGISETNKFCVTAQCLMELVVGVEQESSPGAGDAFVIGDVANALGTVMYSINNGLNFQTNGLFLNVPPGTYTMIALDDAGCLDSVLFTVYSCTLETLISTLPASGGDVGEIHVTTYGGIGPIQFSLNGGGFGSDSIFTMLEPGNYVLVSRDSVGCERTDSITVSTHVGTSNVKENHFIQISPNPGKDVFQITALFYAQPVFINYDVYSEYGELLFNGSIVKYDQQYRGELSLKVYPPGVYYIAFHTGKMITVRRVVKLN